MLGHVYLIVCILPYKETKPLPNGFHLPALIYYLTLQSKFISHGEVNPFIT